MRSFDPQALAGRDVLLVAPHPDDEAIGCGGTVHLLAAAGATVTVVIATRGDRGVDGDGSASVDVRREESRRACEILGTPPPLFLELTSPQLRADPRDAARRLEQLVGTAGHDMILVPGPLERHDTHRAALLASLLADVARAPAAWWGYGVWDALPAAGDDVAEVDVTAARSAKTRAIGAHQSQDGPRSLAAGIAARDMAQAVFSRITGHEPRRAVERLLDLTSLATAVRALPTPDASAAARTTGAWIADRSHEWARSLWE